MSGRITDHVNENSCTGCGSCVNVCPVQAVSMKNNEEGFIYPFIDNGKCIDCGSCAEKCPALHYENHNTNTGSIYYAFTASDEIRRTSSSGGFFYSAAEKILDGGGIVVGAAFDDDMRLRLTYAENEEQLRPMQGSKYVQCDTDNIYNDVVKFLNEGRKVLFTGCPCHAAAMKNFAGEHELLFTVDILCHGVPSQYMFRRYLNEMFPDKRVIDVKFRNKEHMWTSTCIDIIFSDGSRYYGSLRDNDAFEVLFHKSAALRKSCSYCKFCGFPRIGDISMGDFWGIDRIAPGSNDKKGLSIVFPNNKKGENFFNKITGVKKAIDHNVKKIPNRLFPVSGANAGRDDLFRLLRKNNTITEAVDIVINNKHKIGLVGIYTVENFGGALTYYALYKTLCDMGYSVLMIERPQNARHRPGWGRIYNKDPYPDHDKAKIYPDKFSMRELNSYCDTFIVGSDQLFNNVLYNDFGKWCTLDWVRDNKRKIAYAASFGHDKIYSSEQTCYEMSYFMKKFDSFSVREKSGVEICRDNFGINAEWVLDPVFLCDAGHYRKLAENTDKPVKKGYISCYILDPSADKAGMIRIASEKLSVGYDIYTEMIYKKNSDLNGFDLSVNFGGLIEDRLSSIINSDFVIADSFHGICFAIIMKKNFIAIPNEMRGAARFMTILDTLGLSDRMVSSLKQMKEKLYLLDTPIDYEKVYKLLDYEKVRSMVWLKTALERPLNKSLSTYDIMVDYLNAQMTEREKAVIRREAAINRQLRRLCSIHPSMRKICGINDFAEYFRELAKEKERYVIAIAVKDTSGIPFSEEQFKMMSLINIKTDLVGKHWHGYAALIDSGINIDEQCVYNRSAEITAKLDGLNISVKSAPLNAGNIASVIINGEDYSVNSRGINIVVYDKTEKFICDSICFDTHQKSAPCSR